MVAGLIAALLIGGPYLIEHRVNTNVAETIADIRAGSGPGPEYAKGQLDDAFRYPFRRAVIERLTEACETETNPQALGRLVMVRLALGVDGWLTPTRGST